MDRNPQRDNHALTDAERQRIRVIGWDRFVAENRREGWSLLLPPLGIAWANGSHQAKHALMHMLFPDLFTNWRHALPLKDESLVPMAIEQLGPDIRHVRCIAPNGGRIGLRVAATSRPAALAHLRSLGITPLVG